MYDANGHIQHKHANTLRPEWTGVTRDQGVLRRTWGDNFQTVATLNQMCIYNKRLTCAALCAVWKTSWQAHTPAFLKNKDRPQSNSVLLCVSVHLWIRVCLHAYVKMAKVQQEWDYEYTRWLNACRELRPLNTYYDDWQSRRIQQVWLRPTSATATGLSSMHHPDPIPIDTWLGWEGCYSERVAICSGRPTESPARQSVGTVRRTHSPWSECWRTPFVSTKLILDRIIMGRQSLRCCVITHTDVTNTRTQNTWLGGAGQLIWIYNILHMLYVPRLNVTCLNSERWLGNLKCRWKDKGEMTI